MKQKTEETNLLHYKCKNIRMTDKLSVDGLQENCSHV